MSRTIKRADFTEALAFAVEVGRLAEEADHHPDIAIRRYRQVDLLLTTHSAGRQVTEKDFALAQKINDLDDDAIRHTRKLLQTHFQARS